MKSKTSDVIFAGLYGSGFLFNAYRGNDTEGFMQPFRKLVHAIPTTDVCHKRLYRARRIIFDEDVNAGKGIICEGEVLKGGFNEMNSRIPPADKCGMQRLNRIGCPVFYISEEQRTAIMEQKGDIGEAISVAEFSLVKGVRVLDFSAYTHEEISKIISDRIEATFSKNEGFSARQLYFEVQRFLTITDSSEKYYRVSNCVADILKEDTRVSGIRYYSAYRGHNLAIWKYIEDDYKFCGSHIEIIDGSLVDPETKE